MQYDKKRKEKEDDIDREKQKLPEFEAVWQSN